MATFDLAPLKELRSRLDNHPVYQAVTDMSHLRVFMAHHVYSVWDFMSLTKQLQQVIAPAGSPWLPLGDPILRRFINELVLEEETDLAPPTPDGKQGYASHFELYVESMREVGADAEPPLVFLEQVRRQGIQAALDAGNVPEPSRRFMRRTFGFLDTGKPQVVAAALALGREQIIPAMFRALLKRMNISAEQAPKFHYYLERHIHLDEDFHGPMSLRLLESFCGTPQAMAEAQQAAREAIEARIAFWDGVQAALAA